MKKKNEDVYSRLSNELFYVKTETTDEGKNIYSEKGSILHTLKYDDKAILILHTLYVRTDFARECTITLDYLIEQCEYQVNKDSRKSFKNILNKLKEIKLIDFDGEIISGKMLEIDTEPLLLNASGNFFQLSNEEIERFKTIDDLRLRTTLLKLYCYLKARTKKRKKNEQTGKVFSVQVEPIPQVTYQTYELIDKYTGISESRLKKYIDILQDDMKLITYRNFGKKYREGDTSRKLSECPNVYAINNLQTQSVELELELGISQCKHDLMEKGWVITKVDYKNNDRHINGLKGSLIKKQNLNTITEEEINQLNDIIAQEQQYKDEYENYTPKPIEENKPKGIQPKNEDWGDNIKDRVKSMRDKNINPFTGKKIETKEQTYEEFIDNL